MKTIKYIKEFFTLVSGMFALFACAIAGIFVCLAPFGLAIYLGDVLGYNMIIAMGSVVMIYCFYYVIARHFNFIEGI